MSLIELSTASVYNEPRNTINSKNPTSFCKLPSLKIPIASFPALPCLENVAVHCWFSPEDKSGLKCPPLLYLGL